MSVDVVNFFRLFSRQVLRRSTTSRSFNLSLSLNEYQFNPDTETLKCICISIYTTWKYTIPRKTTRNFHFDNCKIAFDYQSYQNNASHNSAYIFISYYNCNKWYVKRLSLIAFSVEHQRALREGVDVIAL